MNKLNIVNILESDKIKVDNLSTMGGGSNLVSIKIHNYFSINNKLKT